MVKVGVIDSHTGGEPTRVVISGGPDLGRGPIAERAQRFRNLHDSFRSAIVNEPRGSDVLVGALLLEPEDPTCTAAVIFFNNASTLGMCGHGTIGLVETLSYLGRIVPGEHRIETPAGTVKARLYPDGTVAVRNVPSYRANKDKRIEVPGIGAVVGDVAYGGNWFFLIGSHGQDLSLSNVEALTDYTWRIRQALAANHVTGPNGQEVDHIELFGPPLDPQAHSRNFVLCPGKAYDRSPCGTGTSAKLACLHADGKLAVGDTWRQESITGSIFEGSIELDADACIPTIKGRAWIIAESTLLLDPSDPLCWGLDGPGR